MSYEWNNLQARNLNVVNNIRVMKYLTRRNIQILLDHIGADDWRDTRDLLGYNRRWGERRVLRELMVEYNREQQGAVRNLVGGIMNRVVDHQTQERLQDIARRITTRRLQMKRGRINPDGDVYDTLNRLIPKYKGKSIRVRMYADGQVVLDTVYNVPTKGFRKWFKQALFDFTEGDSDEWRLKTAGSQTANIIITEGVLIEPQLVPQAFAEGATNCVLKPIKKWIESRLDNVKSAKSKANWTSKLNKIDYYEKEFPTGIPEEQMNEICDYFKIDITIDLPLTEEFMKWRYRTKSLAHFKYLNTRLNHAEHLTDKGTIHELSQEELNELPNKYDFYMYRKSKDGDYHKIITIDGTYVLRDEYTEAVNEFEHSYDMKRYRLDHIKWSGASTFVREGTHFNGTVWVGDQDIETEHIDMKKAYSQFNKCPAYAGFLGKITDYRQCDKIEGIGFYRVGKFNGLPDWLVRMKCYYDMNVYTSVELEWLKGLGVEYTVVEGAWGSRCDFDFSQEFIDQKYYRKWVGQCYQLNTEHSFYIKKTDLEFIENWTSYCKCEFYDYGDEVRVTYPKERAYHLSHIAGFITAYQRMNLFEQIQLMDFDKIVRVTTDDIYFEPHNFEHLDIFRHKFSSMPPTYPPEHFLSNVVEWEDRPITEITPRKHYWKEAFKGAGGNGKTHYNMTDKGLVGVLYVAPSYKLCSAMKSYGYDTAVLARLLDDKIYELSKGHNVIIIDEMSMITNEQRDKIIMDYPDCKLIFCGDPDAQLPPVSGEQMTLDVFDNVHEMNKNYRFTCEKHLELCMKVRKLIEEEEDANEFIFDNYEHITAEQMTYNPETDIILCSTNTNGGCWLTKYGENKWRVLENTRLCCNGDIVLGDKPKFKCEPRHGFTIHSVQGETFEGTIYIDSRRWFDNTMGYTAISRARRYDQIKIIVA